MNAGRHIFDVDLDDDVGLAVYFEEEAHRFRLELSALGMTLMEWTLARHDPIDGLIAKDDLDRILAAISGLVRDLTRAAI